ncbi:MAG: C10 family peptidase [Bacteroidales bacterium]|nr:C10 family peptidase [Bacteroidales bacterium]
MKRYLILTLTLLLTVAALARPRAKAGETLSRKERENVFMCAREFLTNRGADVFEINLSVSKLGKNIVFLTDWKKKRFLLVARDSVAPCLDNRVLAFSVGATRVYDKNDIGIEKLFHYYERTLQQMRDGQRSALVGGPKPSDADAVLSLLKYIKWRQFRLCRFEGIPDGALTGCGATGVGQLMSYYQYPADAIDWSETAKAYIGPDADTAQIAPLVARIARSIQSHFGMAATGSNIYNIRSAMVRDFRFSPRMQLIRSFATEREALRVVYDELHQRRPVLMAGFNHFFVCDGYYRGYYHLNMGWSGNYDGWYRFITPDDRLEEGSVLDEVLVDIRPLPAEAELSLQVQLQEAGTLMEQMTEQQRQDVVRLKVSGPINSADIRCLRQMAGDLEVQRLPEWHGSLAYLDLSDARIMSDTAAYFSYNAAEHAFWIRYDDKKYDFRQMTHDKWLEISNTRATRNAKYDVTEVIADSLYMVSLKPRQDDWGNNLFCQCGNLREVLLPRNLLSVGDYSLHACPILERITVPDLPRLRSERSKLPDCKIEYYEQER